MLIVSLCLVGVDPVTQTRPLEAEVCEALRTAAAQTFLGTIVYSQEMHLLPDPRRMAVAVEFDPKNALVTGNQEIDEALRTTYERIHNRAIQRAPQPTISRADSSITIGLNGDIRLDRLDAGRRTRTTARGADQIWEHSAGSNAIVVAGADDPLGAGSPAAQAMELAIREAESVAKLFVNQYVDADAPLRLLSVQPHSDGTIQAVLRGPRGPVTHTFVRNSDTLLLTKITETSEEHTYECAFSDYAALNGAWIPHRYEYTATFAGDPNVKRIIRTISEISVLDGEALAVQFESPGPWVPGFEEVVYERIATFPDNPAFPLLPGLEPVLLDDAE